MKVIKYVGRFGGAETQGLVFPKDVPVIVERSSLADQLISQPDFVESSLQELESYHAGAEAPVVTAPAAKVKSAPLFTPVETGEGENQ